MKPRYFPFACWLAFLATSCTSSRESKDVEMAAFEPVRTVLETNCVHCHGENHFPEMPAVTSTRALSRLVGPGNWIVPGHPEKSRFYVVAMMPDTAWGAMPPTGHAMSRKEAKVLREWILAGAKVPAANIPLKPRGELPRSR